MGDDYYISPIFRCGSMEDIFQSSLKTFYEQNPEAATELTPEEMIEHQKQLDELRKLDEELMKMGVRTYHDLLTPNAPGPGPSEPPPERATVDEPNAPGPSQPQPPPETATVDEPNAPGPSQPQPPPETATVDEVRCEIQNLISCQESALREFEGKKKGLFQKLLSAMKRSNTQKPAGLRIFSRLNERVIKLRDQIKKTIMDKPVEQMFRARAQQKKLVPGGAAKRGAN